ncbi:calsyntenin-2-like [Engraulis encrasicolus]|uniref:calsyntenin-2-like n=1 Tax=Engraulis encrasicolus TaxID=184585 RepID=UPI002FD1454E
MALYMELLRAVRYANLRPEISVRHFRLTCSQLSGRYTSNTLLLEVNILHSSRAAEHVNHMKAPPTFTKEVHHPLMLQAAESPDVSSVAGSVLLVCVCVLVLVVMGGAYWIHATLQEANTHSDTHTHAGDLWHNPAVTITVNPMESFEEALAAVGQLSEDEEEEEEDDITSADSDSQEEEEDEEELPSMHQESRRRAQQDWDNMAPF